MRDNTRTGSEFDDIFGSSAGDTGYRQPEKPTRTLRPWHKPRKHYVRANQWWGTIERDLNQATPADSNVVSYLSLPGPDMLDVRFIVGELERRRSGGHSSPALRYTGFCEDSDEDDRAILNSTHSEMLRRGVHVGSVVLPDSLESIARKDSVGYQRVRDAAPFTAINIDLCDGLFKRSMGDGLYGAIANLVEIQATSAAPWLFFLTSRCGLQNLEADVASKLMQHLLSFLEACPTVHPYLQDLARSSSLEQIDGPGLASLYTMMVFVYVVMLTRPSLASVTLESVIGYRVGPQSSAVDMISLAIRIAPSNYTQDPSGLSNHQPDQQHSCKPLKQAGHIAAAPADIDELLRNDESTRKQIASGLTTLLTEAGFEDDDVALWLRADHTWGAG
jgi:hypothetical protein